MAYRLYQELHRSWIGVGRPPDGCCSRRHQQQCCSRERKEPGSGCCLDEHVAHTGGSHPPSRDVGACGGRLRRSDRFGAANLDFSDGRSPSTPCLAKCAERGVCFFCSYRAKRQHSSAAVNSGLTRRHLECFQSCRNGTFHNTEGGLIWDAASFHFWRAPSRAPFA